MYTEIQQEIADSILTDVATQGNRVWESDFMSDLQMKFSQNYHDCDYVLQSLVSDYHLLERYNSGFLRLTAEGMAVAGKKFATITKDENTNKKLSVVEKKLKIIKIIVEIVIAIAAFILGRCSSSVF